MKCGSGERSTEGERGEEVGVDEGGERSVGGKRGRCREGRRRSVGGEKGRCDRGEKKVDITQDSYRLTRWSRLDPVALLVVFGHARFSLSIRRTASGAETINQCKYP